MDVDMSTDQTSSSALVRGRVRRFPRGQPFTLRRFDNLGLAYSVVGEAIAKLVRAGELERVFRGVYMRPKVSRFAGRVLPSADTTSISALSPRLLAPRSNQFRSDQASNTMAITASSMPRSTALDAKSHGDDVPERSRILAPAAPSGCPPAPPAVRLR